MVIVTLFLVLAAVVFVACVAGMIRDDRQNARDRARIVAARDSYRDRYLALERASRARFEGEVQA